ncbi:MAG: S41 family peptidase [Chlorobiaceae bacterium]|nr:S41 family peptidase [Chlorobiaceae bacterium]NTV17283.1 S41 family peptidase [Chlorobiaceae bacterium]
MKSNGKRKGAGLPGVFLQLIVPGTIAVLLFFFGAPSKPVSAASAPSAASVHSAAADSTDKEYFEIIKSIDLLGEVYREVSKSYVDTLNVRKLMYAGIDGMLRTLDPYTVFLDEDDSDELDELTTGHYAGIGISITSIEGAVFVTSVVDGYAAAKAGIKIGDSIVSINNKVVKKMSLDEIKKLIKGAAGTPVDFKIERQGSPVFSVRLVREEVRVSAVSYSGILEGIGYIEMQSFGSRSSDDLREAYKGLLSQASEQHLPLKGIILDLRNNPGGLLNVAVDVASLFVDKGSEVVSIRGRSPEMAKSYVTGTPPLDSALPLVVLINSESASAAEIVAGAIQDLDRGVIIGERSYGKGLVQSVLRISYNTTLKLTTSKYYTPSGRLIQKEVHNAVHESRKVLPEDQEKKATQLFFTKGKRKVYGGGGILPDIQLSDPVAMPYLSALNKSGLPFLFSSAYRSTHPVMPSRPLGHHELMALFADFLLSKHFVYTSESEQRLNELKESMKKVQPENTGSALQCFTALQQESGRLKELEIGKESADVAQAIEVEVLRHYNEGIARKAKLDHDPVVKKAIEVLSDSRNYSKILHP